MTHGTVVLVGYVAVDDDDDNTISKARYNLAHCQQYPWINRYYYLVKTMIRFAYY